MRLQKVCGLTVAALLFFPFTTQARTAPASGQASSQSTATEQRDPGLYMTFQTDKGNIACKLFEKESPITVGKMVGLAIGKIS